MFSSLINFQDLLGYNGSSNLIIVIVSLYVKMNVLWSHMAKYLSFRRLFANSSRFIALLLCIDNFIDRIIKFKWIKPREI
jgi:hypothetical protein